MNELSNAEEIWNSQSGYDKLWRWFGLSYASYLVLPRVLMHEMPDEWQEKMAELLEEYDEKFSKWPEEYGTRVQLIQDGKLVKTPEWIINYRHPDLKKISEIKSE